MGPAIGPFGPRPTAARLLGAERILPLVPAPVQQHTYAKAGAHGAEKAIDDSAADLMFSYKGFSLYPIPKGYEAAYPIFKIDPFATLLSVFGESRGEDNG